MGSGESVVISPKLKMTSVDDKTSSNRNECKRIYDSAKSAVTNAVSGSAMTAAQIKEMKEYADKKYPEKSFLEYLADMDIDVSEFTEKTELFFPTSDKNIETTGKSGKATVYSLGIEGFAPNVKGAELGSHCSRKMKSEFVEVKVADPKKRRSFKTISYTDYSFTEAHEINILTFEKGEEQKAVTDELKAEIKKLMGDEAEKGQLQLGSDKTENAGISA